MLRRHKQYAVTRGRISSATYIIPCWLQNIPKVSSAIHQKLEQPSSKSKGKCLPASSPVVTNVGKLSPCASPSRSLTWDNQSYVELSAGVLKLGHQSARAAPYGVAYNLHVSSCTHWSRYTTNLCIPLMGSTEKRSDILHSMPRKFLAKKYRFKNNFLQALFGYYTAMPGDTDLQTISRFIEQRSTSISNPGGA